VSHTPEALWDVRQVAERLRVARSTIYDWVITGYIPHVRLGTAVRFRPSDIEAWVQSQANPGRQQRVPAQESFPCR
jgi:excisionase family DNA binding protein